MSRPELGKLNVGDQLVMVSGTPGRRDGKRAYDVRVAIVGRKYVHVIEVEFFDRYVEDPAVWKWRLRKFLIADQREGEPDRRVGYSAHIATAEQRAYDVAEGEARDYLEAQGVLLDRRSPWYDRRTELANLLRFVDQPAGPDA